MPSVRFVRQRAGRSDALPALFSGRDDVALIPAAMFADPSESLSVQKYTLIYDKIIP
jgi:hypothetical protein